MDGESDNEGKVEICIDGIWMTTDANYWFYSHAQVVCRQLGYYDKCNITVEPKYGQFIIIYTVGSVAIKDMFWKTKSERIGYRYLSCIGNEISLSGCSYQNPSNHLRNWYNDIRAGVDCQMKSQSGMVLLIIIVYISCLLLYRVMYKCWSYSFI